MTTSSAPYYRLTFHEARTLGIPIEKQAEPAPRLGELLRDAPVLNLYLRDDKAVLFSTRSRGFLEVACALFSAAVPGIGPGAQAIWGEASSLSDAERTPTARRMSLTSALQILATGALAVWSPDSVPSYETFLTLGSVIATPNVLKGLYNIFTPSRSLLSEANR